VSSTEDILEVFYSDIAEKTRIVEQKFGLAPFYENFKGMRQFKLMDFDPSATKYQGEK
jgi:hypothetical protein